MQKHHDQLSVMQIKTKDVFAGFEELEDVLKAKPIPGTALPPKTDPVTFAKQEWNGFDWLSPQEDRGRFMIDFIDSKEDAIVMGAKETAKSLTFSILVIWFQLYTKQKVWGIIAGSEDQAAITYRHYSRLLRTGKHTRSFLVTEPRATTVQLTNGARTWIYAASYYRAHGEHPDGLIADEAVLASRAQDGEVLKGALGSVTTGGRRIMGSAPYQQDTIFMPTWRDAPERGYRRYGPWRKHPWAELEPPFATVVNRRPWIPIEKQIEEAKLAMLSPLSNYSVFWIGDPEAGTGDVFKPDKVDGIVAEYDVMPTKAFNKALGVDPAFGSSLFGLCGIEERNGALHVILSEAYERPSFDDMARAIAKVYHEDAYDCIYADSSNKPMIEELQNYGCRVEAVSFSTENKEMIASTQFFIDKRPPQLLIDKGFPELIHELKNAQWAKGGTKLDKAGQLTLDRLESMECALRHWTRESRYPVWVSPRK